MSKLKNFFQDVGYLYGQGNAVGGGWKAAPVGFIFFSIVFLVIYFMYLETRILLGSFAFLIIGILSLMLFVYLNNKTRK